MMMSDKHQEVVVDMRTMLRATMAGLELNLEGLGLVLAGMEEVIGTEAEVLRDTTVVVEDEVMGMPNQHLHQRRRRTEILIGSTNSSWLVSRGQCPNAAPAWKGDCVEKSRRAVEIKMRERGGEFQWSLGSK